MTSTRISQKVTLGCSLLFVCFCVSYAYYVFDLNQIKCRLRHLFDDVAGVREQVQARFDAQIELTERTARQDHPLTSVQWSPKLRLLIGEYACGYDGGWSRAYGSDDTPAEILARFRQRYVDWRVERQTEDMIYLSNRGDTARLTLTIIRPRKTPREGPRFGPPPSGSEPGDNTTIPTVYEIMLGYGEPYVRIPG